MNSDVTMYLFAGCCSQSDSTTSTIPTFSTCGLRHVTHQSAVFHVMDLHLRPWNVPYGAPDQGQTWL
jgi:hypothetical protein